MATQHHFRLTFWGAFWVFLIDQLTKYLVVQTLDLKTVGRIDVVSPFLEFRMAWNRGINFGLFADFDMRWVLVAISLVVCVFILWWLRRDGGNKWAFVSAGVAIGGALGNVIDRVLYGAVADFLNMSCCGIDNPYAFNVADIAIFAGILGLVWLTDSPKKKNT